MNNKNKRKEKKVKNTTIYKNSDKFIILPGIKVLSQINFLSKTTKSRTVKIKARIEFNPTIIRISCILNLRNKFNNNIRKIRNRIIK
jgi:hypothetical protein